MIIHTRGPVPLGKTRKIAAGGIESHLFRHNVRKKLQICTSSGKSDIVIIIFVMLNSTTRTPLPYCETKRYTLAQIIRHLTFINNGTIVPIKHN